MKCYELIHAERRQVPVQRACALLGVSRASYYAWLERGQTTKRARDDARLESALEAAYHEAKGRYGSPRLHRVLQARGVRVGRRRVIRLMRKRGLQAKRRGHFRTTTKANPRHAPAPNVLNRAFAATAPNAVWAGDITYIRTREGWLYLAVLLDLYSRRVVGWSMSTRLDTTLALSALESALSTRRPPRGFLHHSDRGSQYTSVRYQERLRRAGAITSMSRKGECWDNAVAESFFASLKVELVRGADFETRAEARRHIFEYLEVFYNRKRLHSSLGFQSPVDFEAQNNQINTAA